MLLWEEKRAFASWRWRREREGLESEEEDAASKRRVDSDRRVSYSGVETGSGLERLDVHFARQTGHVHIKWYRELSSD